MVYVAMFKTLLPIPSHFGASIELPCFRPTDPDSGQFSILAARRETICPQPVESFLFCYVVSKWLSDCTPGARSKVTTELWRIKRWNAMEIWEMFLLITTSLVTDEFIELALLACLASYSRSSPQKRKRYPPCNSFKIKITIRRLPLNSWALLKKNFVIRVMVINCR